MRPPQMRSRDPIKKQGVGANIWCAVLAVKVAISCKKREFRGDGRLGPEVLLSRLFIRNWIIPHCLILRLCCQSLFQVFYKLCFQLDQIEFANFKSQLPRLHNIQDETLGCRRSPLAGYNHGLTLPHPS